MDGGWIQCPYCGEPIELVVDPSIAVQEYVEDCSVCCRPVTVTAIADASGGLHLTGRREDEC